MPFDFTIVSLICQGRPRQSSKLCMKKGGGGNGYCLASVVWHQSLDRVASLSAFSPPWSGINWLGFSGGSYRYLQWAACSGCLHVEI